MGQRPNSMVQNRTTNMPNRTGLPLCQSIERWLEEVTAFEGDISLIRKKPGFQCIPHDLNIKHDIINYMF